MTEGLQQPTGKLARTFKTAINLSSKCWIQWSENAGNVNRLEGKAARLRGEREGLRKEVRTGKAKPGRQEERLVAHDSTAITKHSGPKERNLDPQSSPLRCQARSYQMSVRSRTRHLPMHLKRFV